MQMVAPHVGAWIEIQEGDSKADLHSVAPHVGAWIEIAPLSPSSDLRTSHPTWVRGLKYDLLFQRRLLPVVAPHVGAWIEIAIGG